MNNPKSSADLTSVELDKLPVELRKEVESQGSRASLSGDRKILIASVEQRMFSGPVPPPDFLAAYEQIEQGMASRLVALAEKSSEHIRARQTSAQRFEAAQIFLGQIFAFVLCIAAFCCGTMLLLNDKNVAGFVSLVSALVILAGSFYHKKLTQESKSNQSSKPPETGNSKTAPRMRRKK